MTNLPIVMPTGDEGLAASQPDEHYMTEPGKVTLAFPRPVPDDVPIHAVLTREEARILYGVMWYALSYADAKSFCTSLMVQMKEQSPEMQLQADEVGRMAHTLANVLRKFNFQPPAVIEVGDEEIDCGSGIGGKLLGGADGGMAQAGGPPEETNVRPGHPGGSEVQSHEDDS